MAQSTSPFLNLPAEIRMMIYKVWAKNITSLRRGQSSYRFTMIDGVHSTHLAIPVQFFTVCRLVSDEAAAAQYSNLRIWSSDFHDALRFVQTIGSTNAGLMRSLRVECQDHLDPLDDIPDWLENNAHILRVLKHIVIEYRLDRSTELEPSELIEILQRLVNMLFDNPFWASHRMQCQGFDRVLGTSRWRSFAIMLVKR